MATDSRTLRVVVVGDSTSAQRSIRDVGREADTLKAKASATQVALGTFASMGAQKLLDMAGSAVTLGIKTASGMEQSQVAFSNMLGSAEKARVFLGDLQKLAASTPFEMTDLTRGAQRLMAMGFAAKDVIPTLTAAGDAVSAMGGSAEQVDQVTMALGQMQAKGKISGEEILQLTEAGIPAMKILAAQYGVTAMEMQKMVTKGEVMADEALPKLISGISNGTKETQKFGGMMAAQSETLQGKWSTLSDTVSQGLGNMFTKAMPAMNAGIDAISTAATRVFASVGPAGTAVKDVFVNGIIPAARDVWTIVGPLLTDFANLLVTLWEKVKPLEIVGAIFRGIGDALSWMARYSGVIQTLAVSVGAAVVAWKLWTTAIDLWNKRTLVMQAITKGAAAVQAMFNAVMAANPIAIAVIALAALVAGIVYAYKHFEGFRKVVDAVWSGIKTATQAVASWFMSYVWPVFVSVFNGIVSAAKGLWSALSVVFNAIRAVVEAVVSFFMSYVWPVLRFVFSVIAGAVKILFGAFSIYFGMIRIAVQAVVYFFMTYVWPVIRTYFNLIAGVVQTLWNAFSKAFGWIRDKVGSVVNWVRQTAWPILSGAFNLMKTAVQSLWDKWRSIFDNIRSKVETVMDAAKTAFTKAKDAIGTTWDKLRDLAKKPVNFVIETVYNNGIRAFWNAIASKVGAKPLESIPKLAGGGRGIPSVPGIVGDWVPFYGQAGEYVLNRKQVANAGGWRNIEALFGRSGRDGASSGHYAKGGIIGGIGRVGGWLSDKAGDLVKGSLLRVTEPLINTIKAAIGAVPGTGDIADAMRKMPTNLLDRMLAWIKPKDKAPVGDGSWDGVIRPGVLGEMQKFALAQKGKRYGWATQGPNTYDCSGLVSNLWAIATGNRRYTRYFSTSGMGPGRHGFVSGPGRFTVYLGPGHTAANIDGLHAEAYGGNGTPLAIGRIGTRLSYYHTRMHLPGLAGGGNISRDQQWGSFLLRGWPEPPAGYGIPRSYNPLLDMGTLYDSGGILPPGTTVARNNTGRNEYVFTEDQLSRGGVTVNVTVQGNVTTERDLAESIATAVRDALLRKAARNGGRTGLK